MPHPQGVSYHYSIDRNDRLVSVSDSWLDFAKRNAAPELIRERVLDRPIWDFVSGRKTREIYQQLFWRVRDRGATLSVPFRCDSPDRLRFMQLDLCPGEEDAIDFRAIVERELPRRHVRLLDRLARRAEYAFSICSFCRRIFAFGAWLEPEEAVSRLGWLESESPPEMEEYVCDDCERQCHAQLAAQTPQQRPGPPLGR